MLMHSHNRRAHFGEIEEMVLIIGYLKPTSNYEAIY